MVVVGVVGVENRLGESLKERLGELLVALVEEGGHVPTRSSVSSQMNSPLAPTGRCVRQAAHIVAP